MSGPRGVTKLLRDKPLVALWIAVGVVVLGRLVDLQWHLTHDEFEGTREQVRAHLVVWIGVLLVLAVTVVAIRNGIRSPGFRLSLIGAATYVPVAVWHFIEHANGNDPDVAHVLLGLSDVAIITGAIWATISMRRAQPHEAAGLSDSDG
jgi:hypothetical protein